MPETILPPGECWTGDPCCVISHSHRRNSIKSIDEETGAANCEGHRAAVFHTQSGDG